MFIAEDFFTGRPVTMALCGPSTDGPGRETRAMSGQQG
jgi:hypothetical protein